MRRLRYWLLRKLAGRDRIYNVANGVIYTTYEGEAFFYDGRNMTNITSGPWRPFTSSTSG